MVNERKKTVQGDGCAVFGMRDKHTKSLWKYVLSEKQELSYRIESIPLLLITLSLFETQFAVQVFGRIESNRRREEKDTIT
jgi:hypothetical protein